MTDLISFPPTILLVEFFRRIKKRKTRIFKLKYLLEKYNLNNKKNAQVNLSKIKNKKILEVCLKYKFPWWCKFIAYFISFVFVGVSLFFIIIQGINFGNDKVQKWLSSILISIFTSILFTQPIKVKNDLTQIFSF